MLCSTGMFHQWSLAVFLLCSTVPLYGRPIDELGNRIRRSVSHVQLMHDKGDSLQAFKRRLWLQKLLDEVHTAGERAPTPHNRPNIHTFIGSVLHQKSTGGTKNLSVFHLDREGGNLPQETNKSMAYKDQPLKVATKRKKVRSGRRRESEKRRRRTRSARTRDLG
ncbi:parathyroid hormone-related protein-like [Osmerus eperlanus]|uniref:parathyroid hormone-related protein-like n=1 Tax=Osmerus eperlanus TaxID=29151 RepID=UPI002E14070E